MWLKLLKICNSVRHTVLVSFEVLTTICPFLLFDLLSFYEIFQKVHFEKVKICDKSVLVEKLACHYILEHCPADQFYAFLPSVLLDDCEFH